MYEPDTPSIACILVHWNNFPDTHACLTALAAQTYPHLRILVIDNGSTDTSLAQLRAAHPSVTFIAHPENSGFPRACNLAARHPLALSANYLWLLNNDTLAPPGTAAKLAATATAKPQAGIIGAVLHFLHDPSRIQAWGGGRISRWTAYNTHYIAPTALTPNSYITFASALIHRQAFDQLGGLFEGAFMYFEDSDFSLRAQALGFQLAVAPDTAILHKEGGSANPRSLQTDRTITTAALLFLGRHSPFPPLSYALFLAARLTKRLLRLDLPAIKAVLHGTRDWHRRLR